VGCGVESGRESAVRPLSISVVADGTLELALHGDIVFENAAEALQLLRDAIARHQPRAVRLDLADVTFLDSAGVGLLVRMVNVAERAHVAIRMSNPSTAVRARLRIAGVDESLGFIEPDVGSPRPD
jgi:anti-sigma B factor antagonist